jgi:hypothetical protein
MVHPTLQQVRRGRADQTTEAEDSCGRRQASGDTGCTHRDTKLAEPRSYRPEVAQGDDAGPGLEIRRRSQEVEQRQFRAAGTKATDNMGGGYAGWGHGAQASSSRVRRSPAA